MFNPFPFPIPATSHHLCRACVIMPARNEENSLAAALDALASQVDLFGEALEHKEYEVLLLLNNCTDRSARVAADWKVENPEVGLHIIERTLPQEIANIGTARRLLMDTAWERHRASQRRAFGLLSTDSDSIVAEDWIVRNLAALDHGADAVGGVIALKTEELAAMPAALRKAYENDLRYRALTAELEDLLDPQDGDPWPRHLDHFAASLACTPEAYERAGGIPHVATLEDVVFIDALRRVDARIRHDPSVKVYTSARLDGRVEVGLSFQLRLWEKQAREGIEHRVPSAAFLQHRFRTLRALRRLSLGSQESAFLSSLEPRWRVRLKRIAPRRGAIGSYLVDVDCDRLIEETFYQQHEELIDRVNNDLVMAISNERTASLRSP